MVIFQDVQKNIKYLYLKIQIFKKKKKAVHMMWKEFINEDGSFKSNVEID